MTDILHFFPGQGFRPAIYLNDFIGPRLDCPLIVPAPDADIAYSAKFEPFGHMPASGYAWGTWIPAAAPAATAETVLSAATAGPAAAPPFSAGPLIPGPWPSEPEWPCCVIREPDAPLPPVAPIPTPASASLLIAAVAAFAIIRRRT